MIAPVLQNYKFYDKVSEKSVQKNLDKSSDKEIVNVDITVNPNSEEISDDDYSHLADKYCPVHSTEYLLGDPSADSIGDENVEIFDFSDTDILQRRQVFVPFTPRCLQYIIKYFTLLEINVMDIRKQ